MKLKYLSLFAIPILGLTLVKNPISVKVNAQTFTSSDWTLVAPNGADPWIQKDGNALINTNKGWFPANYLMNNNTVGLNVTDEGRLAFEVKTAFHSETDALSLQHAQWRGFVLFYLNDANWLAAGVKWDASATTQRDDPVELQEMMVYGKINNDFYQTWGTSSWQVKEYNDLWTDNCGIHITDPMELTVQYTPAMEGNSINADTDLITFIAKTSSKTITKQQRLRSLSEIGYFDLASNISNMSAGLFSINVDAVMDDSVTFTKFEYGAIKPVFGEYEKVTSGFINSQVTLPTVYASSQVEDSIATTISVKDPDNQPVEVTSNKFTPTKMGEYKITYTAVDKFHSSASDTYVMNVINGYSISIEGEQVTSGKIGDVITLPTFFVQDHPEIVLETKVIDPHGDIVTISSNSFIATIEGDYIVKVTSTSGGVAPLQYEINIVDPFVPTYHFVEDGERITTGVVGDKIVVPKYSVDGHDEIEVLVKVLSPLDEEVKLYANAFSASRVGTYKVNVQAAPGKYIIEEINYDIVISNAETHDSEDEDPRIPDPNANNYGYGVRSAGVYFLLGGIALGVSLLSVGGFFAVKLISKSISKKRMKDE